MRLLLALLVVLSIAAPAMAQDMLREHRANDPTAKIINPDQKAPTTLSDFSNLYYDSCTKSNTDPKLDEYVQTQCACTSIKMAEFMNLNDMKVLFTKTKEGDFQQARVLMLAYSPCLQQSIHDFIFDNCFYDEKVRQQFQNERKVCECYAKGVADYTSRSADHFIPGFNRSGFDSSKSVPNPFSYIVTSDFFPANTDHYFDKCVMTEERHW